MTPHELEELDMTDETDGSAYSSGPSGSTRETGPIGPILDAVDGWLSRFIRTTTPEDIHLLTLWAAHTYVVEQTYTSPRLQIDSVMPGSGKTTCLEHLAHLVESLIVV